MLKCLEAAHICITVSAAKLLKGWLAEARLHAPHFLSFYCQPLKKEKKSQNQKHMPGKDKGYNWAFKVDKKRTRKHNTQQKETNQQRHLKIFNNELYVYLRRQ